MNAHPRSYAGFAGPVYGRAVQTGIIDKNHITGICIYLCVKWRSDVPDIFIG